MLPVLLDRLLALLDWLPLPRPKALILPPSPLGGVPYEPPGQPLRRRLGAEAPLSLSFVEPVFRRGREQAGRGPAGRQHRVTVGGIVPWS
jgi:hypothetical protein